MDKVLDTCNSGICLFSVEVLQNFLKKEKVRSKKIIDKFQKDKKLYVTTQKEGVWVPIVGIDSVNYVIRLEGVDEPFDDEWEQKLEYDGFNLEIKEHLCISDIGLLNPFDANDFSGYEKFYQTLDKKTLYQQFKYDVPSGKYLLGIKGYARKQATGHESSSENPNFGFFFSLVKVEEFTDFKNPREDDLYEFNIAWLTRSKEAEIHWLSEAEGGRKEPPTDKKYYPVIELEDGRVCNLAVIFNGADRMNCRVSVLFNHSLDRLLYCNAEYIICEETYKRGKSKIQKVGRIVIK